MDVWNQTGFLGTGAPLLSDLNLLAYILILVPLMLVGFYFARRKMFEPYHKFTMTTITLVNWGLILFIMAVRYGSTVAQEMPGGITKIADLLPTIHLITGGLAQIVATYLVIRMWFEDVLPEWMKVKRIKRYMRFTLAMWITTAVLGIVTYFIWYVIPESPLTGVNPPAATPEVTPDFTPEVVPNGTAEVAPITPPDAAPTMNADAATINAIVEATVNAMLTMEAPPVTPSAATPEVQPAATPEVGAFTTDGLQVAQTIELAPDPEPDPEPEDRDDDNSGSGSGNSGSGSSGG
jgi:uncharacterized membrane protein YozB (DUF420 family)